MLFLRRAEFSHVTTLEPEPTSYLIKKNNKSVYSYILQYPYYVTETDLMGE